MKKIFTVFFCVSACFILQGLFGTRALAQVDSVATYSIGAPNNAQGGIAFNVGSNAPVDIDSVRIGLYQQFTQTIYIWYNPTTPINGQPNITTANGWILHDSLVVTNITSATYTAPTWVVLPLNTPLPIPANDAIGLWIGNNLGFGVAYSNLTATTTHTDGVVSIYTGTNVGYGGNVPSPTFTVRQFNGAVYYSNSYSGTIDLSPVSMTSPVLPPNCYTATDTVNVVIKNSGQDTIFFATDSATVTTVITGPNPQTFSVVLNSGFLAPGSTQTVNMSNAYNMSATGVYNFLTYTSLVPADSLLTNDTLAPISINNNPAGGTLTASSSSICSGNSVTLSFSGSSGTFVYQMFNGSTWVNLTQTGPTISVTPSSTTDYRVEVCGGVFTTPTQTITVNNPVAPTVTPATRCGFGPVTLGANGTGNLYWFPSAVGGFAIDTGYYYTTPNLGTSTTYYVENQVLGGTCNVGKVNNQSGGGVGANGNGLNFTVSNPIIIDSLAYYPLGIGSFQIEIINTGNNTTAYTSPVINHPTTANGTKRFTTLNAALQPGNYRIVLANYTGLTQLYSDAGTNVTYPYNGCNNEVSIQSGYLNGASTFNNYMYFYDWYIRKYCNSTRVPVTATITAAPALALGANDSAICAGDTVQLSAISANTNYTYSWSPNTNISGTAGSTVLAWPPNNTAYILSAIDNGTGCTAYDTLTITTTVVPVSLPTATPSTVCSGSSMQLTVSNYTPGLQYSWTASAGPNPPATHNPTIQPTTGLVPDTITYTVTVLDAPSGCFQNGSINVVVNPTTSINIGPDTIVCQYSDITINAGSNYSTYLWNNGSIGQLRFIPAIPFTQSVVVTVTNMYGCAAVDSRLFQVIPAPSINLGPDREICVTGQVTLNAGATHTSYQWSNGDTTSTSTYGPNLSSGWVWVTVTNQAGCSKRDSLFITVNPCVGITEMEQGATLSVYPNPGNGHFFVEFGNVEEASGMLEVYNLQGQRVYGEPIRMSDGYRHEVTLNGMSRGVYLVRVVSEEFMTTRRIIIQ